MQEQRVMIDRETWLVILMCTFATVAIFASLLETYAYWFS